MFWFLGDSAMLETVEAMAEEVGEVIFNSSKPEATPEEVWTSQVHDARGRKWTLPFTAVVYLPDTDYDSELTLWHVLRCSPKDAKVIFLVPPDAPMVREGLTHMEVEGLTVLEAA